MRSHRVSAYTAKLKKTLLPAVSLPNALHCSLRWPVKHCKLNSVAALYAVKFFIVWTGQAVWVWVTLLPVLILNSTERNPGFRWSDVVGGVIWGAGFACELTADLQKQQWRKDPANKGRFINVGDVRTRPQ